MLVHNVIKKKDKFVQKKKKKQPIALKKTIWSITKYLKYKMGRKLFKNQNHNIFLKINLQIGVVIIWPAPPNPQC